MSVNDLLEEAEQLRAKGDARAAITVWLDAIEQSPEDPFIHESVARAYDSIGREADAIPHYEKAIALGLDGDDRLHAYIGLGSSQRALGRYTDAATTLDTCLGEFPDSYAAQTFRAMAQYNEGDAKGAFESLLDLHARTCGDEAVRGYRGALQLYAEDIEAVYE